MITIYNPTSNEYEILRLLWTAEEGLTAAEMYNRIPEKFASRTALHPLLNNMMDKGIVIVSGMKPSTRAYARVFQAGITQEQYSIEQVKQNTASAKDKRNKLSNISIALLGSGGVKASTLAKIEALLSEDEEV